MIKVSIISLSSESKYTNPFHDVQKAVLINILCIMYTCLIHICDSIWEAFAMHFDIDLPRTYMLCIISKK